MKLLKNGTKNGAFNAGEMMTIRVLYIEDNKITAKTNKELVAGLRPDVELVHVENFSEAVIAFMNQSATGRFDLIVSDFEFLGQQPGSMTGGIDFYKWAKEYSASIGTVMPPHVFLSANHPEELAEDLRKQGIEVPVARISTKPVFLTEVIKKFEFDAPAVPAFRASARFASCEHP